MAEFKRAVGTVAGGSQQNIITAAKTTVIIGLIVANTSFTVSTVTLEAAGSSLRKTVSVPVAGAMPWGAEGKLVLLAGDVLTLTCGVGGVDFVCSYLEP